MPCSMERPFGQFRSAALVLPLPNSLCALSSLAGRIVWETEKLLSKKLKHWYAIIMAFFFFFFLLETEHTFILDTIKKNQVYSS